MDVADQLESYFGAAAGRLGREVGLDEAEAARAVREELRVQVAALARGARTGEGRAQLREAVENLPVFPAVEVTLDEPGAAANLRQAGELLGSVLLDQRVGAEAVTDLTAERVQHLRFMLLPLLLSFLGQRGLTSGDAPRLLSDLQAALQESGGQAAVGLADGALTAAGLADFLRGQLQGPAAERLGRAAGFTSSTASRAAQAALPVILGGLIQRGATEVGAADLLTRMREAERLTDAGGGLNLALLTDQAEAARIEGQGRGLLGLLFSNLDALTGRFGSATSGSGSGAGRLLALMTPLVFGLVGRRVRAANLDARGLSALLTDLRDRLPDLLPPGLSSLKALLTPPASPTPPSPPAGGPGRGQTVASAIPQVTSSKKPSPTAAPPATPRTTVKVPAVSAPPPVAATPPPASATRRGLPWWPLALVLLLLLGGGWFLWSQPALVPGAATESVPIGALTVTTPVEDAVLPAEDFVLGGTGPAGHTLRVEEQGQLVQSVEVGPDGNWQVAVPAPSAGEHTYTVIDAQTDARRDYRLTFSAAENASP